MTEQEARAEASRLDHEHPEREQYDFLARDDGDGQWSVVRVKLPEGVRKPGKTGTATEAPSEAPQESPTSDPNRNPYWGIP